MQNRFDLLVTDVMPIYMIGLSGEDAPADLAVGGGEEDLAWQDPQKPLYGFSQTEKETIL